MGSPETPRAVKLFVGMLAPAAEWFSRGALALEKQFGPVDFESFPRPWAHTDHYAREMGPRLWRKFVFFRDLISPESLWRIKQATNRLEREFSENRGKALCRRLNLDPGYLAEPKVVLASTKDYSHRLYLQGGIYAEVTLLYEGGGFRSLPHTYPDYRTAEYLSLFDQVRKAYRARLREV